jgi:hypothetical protein
MHECAKSPSLAAFLLLNPLTEDARERRRPHELRAAHVPQGRI